MCAKVYNWHALLYTDPATKALITVHSKHLKQENANLYVLDEHLMQGREGKEERNKKRISKSDWIHATSKYSRIHLRKDFIQE